MSAVISPETKMCALIFFRNVSPVATASSEVTLHSSTNCFTAPKITRGVSKQVLVVNHVDLVLGRSHLLGPTLGVALEGGEVLLEEGRPALGLHRRRRLVGERHLVLEPKRREQFHAQRSSRTEGLR